jgi:hypothetical protein
VIRLGLLSQADAPTKAQAANLSGLARVNPLLKFAHLGGGPGEAVDIEGRHR